MCKNCNHTEENSISLHEILKTNDIVAVDTCTIMDESFLQFMEVYKSIYQQYDTRLSFHHAVLRELNQINKNSEKSMKDRQKARERMYFLYGLYHDTSVNFILNADSCDQGQVFADPLFNDYIIKNRNKSRIAIITQDKNLTEDLLRLNNIESFEGYSVRVLRLSNGNLLERYACA